MGFGGGLFGALIGGFIAGPLGALIGGGIGMLLGNSGNKKQGVENCPWLMNFFTCLGKLAKSDGRVSEDEVQFVKTLLKEWKFPPEDRQKLIRCFNDGRDSAEDFASLARKLAGSIPPFSSDAVRLRNSLTALFCTLVAIDRVADPNEVAMLRQAGKILNTEHVVNDFFSSTGGFRGSGGGRDTVSLEECYKLLDISADATDQEVKKAFRKKAVTCHPDKIQGAGLSNEQIQQAKEKFQQISNAYDTICKHRGIK